MRIARVDEIEERQLAADPLLQLHILDDIGRRESGRADAAEILGEALVVHELGTRHTHQLDAKAQYADIVDIGRRGRSRPGKAYPGRKLRRRGENSCRKAAGMGLDDEPPAHDAVRLNIAGAFVRARTIKGAAIVAHRGDDRPHTCLLPGQNLLVNRKVRRRLVDEAKQGLGQGVGAGRLAATSREPPKGKRTFRLSSSNSTRWPYAERGLHRSRIAELFGN